MVQGITFHENQPWQMIVLKPSNLNPPPEQSLFWMRHVGLSFTSQIKHPLVFFPRSLGMTR